MRLLGIACLAVGVSLAQGALTQGALTQGALAQDTADPGEIERRIEQLRPAPKREPPPGISRPAPPPAPEAGLSFVLSAVTLEGATVLDPAELGALYAEFLARSVGPADLEEIARRITERYAEAGYFLSRALVPPQEVQGGVLRVRVIEGYIAKVSFEGAARQAALLERYRGRFTEQRPARLGTVERTLLLIDALPGLSVEDIQAAALDEEGAHELILTLRDRPVSADAFLDNRGTPEVGRSQAWTRVALNSVLGLGEEIHGAVATVPEDTGELRYAELGLAQPLGTTGAVLGLSAAGSAIDAGGELARQETEARSTTAKAELRYPLLLSRRQAAKLRGSFEVRSINEDRFRTSTIDDRVRVLRLQGDYAVQDNLGGTSFLALEASQGLDILGASGPDARRPSRFDADGRFTKLKLDAIRVQEIWGPVSLRLAGQGQLALDPLLSSEEFLLGGSQFGRGFDFGEISGEDGLAGSAEIRFARDRDGSLLSRYEVYGFYDEGHLWNDASPAGSGHELLRSLGGGVRLNLIESVQASLEAAKPLNRDVETTGEREVRVFFSVSASF